MVLSPTAHLTRYPIIFQIKLYQQEISNEDKAIAHGELSKPENAALKADSLAEAEKLLSRFEGVDIYELGVEIAVRIILYLYPDTGY